MSTAASSVVDAVGAPPRASASAPPPAAARRDLAREALRGTIEGAAPEAERRAAIDLYRGAGDEVEPPLRTLGADRDAVVRRWAALALERTASPALVPALAQVAASEPDAAVRHVLERTLRHLDAR